MADTLQARPTIQQSEWLKRVTVDYASPYDLWVDSTGVPVHTGYYVEDVRTVEVGWWEERQCHAAFLKLAGCEGVTEARVTEIPPGKTLPPLRFALDEVVYVADGRGLTTVLPTDGPPKTFEWQKHSLFIIPRGATHQFSNAQGNSPARLLHYNWLPITMSVVPDPEFFFDNPYDSPYVGATESGELYAEAKIVSPTAEAGAPGLSRGMAYWIGNFFPDMRAWDKMVPFKGRGAGGHVVWVRYPISTMTNHMSIFPARSYRKAHRHGPGVVIIIPAGEGFSVMWREGEEKVFIPWHEGSVFVPPNRAAPARYLAFHAPRGIMNTVNDRVEDQGRDQIEYPDEDPWIRQTFEGELAKRGLTSIMPDEAYRDRKFEWNYTGGE